MFEDVKWIVNHLSDCNETIATMESCTGGSLADMITDVNGASKVLKFSAVTYSNEYKIKMGVSRNIIDTYSVYSIETANEMSRKISLFANSDYGIGITGKLNRKDENNPYGEDNLVFISIYDAKKDDFYNFEVNTNLYSKAENKRLVVEKLLLEFKKILENDKNLN